GAAELVVEDRQPLGLGRAFGGPHRADDALLELERLPPLPGLGGEVAQTAQRTEVTSPGLEELPVQRPRFLVPSRSADRVGPSEQYRGFGVVLAGRGRPVPVEEALEVEADRKERAERGEHRHGEDGRARGWHRGAAPRAPSPWPCAPLAR